MGDLGGQAYANGLPSRPRGAVHMSASCGLLLARFGIMCLGIFLGFQGGVVYGAPSPSFLVQHGRPSGSGSIQGLGITTGVEEGDRRPPWLKGFEKAERGWELLEQGVFRQALQAFVEAADVVPEEATVWLGMGITHRQLGDVKSAVSTLEHAIMLDMGLTQAHGFLGALYAHRGELERALHHYRIARAQDPNDIALQSRLDQVAKEYHVEQTLDRVYAAHFDLYYASSLFEAEAIHAVVDQLERAYLHIGTAFAFFPEAPIRVMLHPAQQFHITTGSPAWVHGFYDGRIHLVLSRTDSSTQVPTRLIRHEYTHALLDQLGGGKVAVWLNEGLARFFEVDNRQIDQGFIPTPADYTMMFDSLNGDLFSWSHEEADRAYTVGRRATEQLIAQFGMKRVREFLAELFEQPLSRQDGFRDVFLAHFPHFLDDQTGQEARGPL